jgi:predicted ATPase
LRVLDEASAMTHDQHVWEAELHRLKGELVRPGGGDDAGITPAEAPAAPQAGQPAAEAEVCFRHALRVARGQQARSLELRAGTSLARLWASQGKRAEARDLLAPIYGWFTEGFDTPDLREARGLLDALR